MSRVELRGYQNNDTTSILSAFKKNTGVMYQLPTGGGKSVVVAEIIEKIQKGKRVLFMVHRRELVFQMTDRLRGLGLHVGVVISDIEEHLDSNIIIGSIATLTRDRRIETILAEAFDYVIIDEAHRLRTPSYDKVLEHLKGLNKGLKILGVTATPYRSDGLDFREYVDVLIKSLTVAELIKKGFLAEPRTFTVSIGDIDNEVVKYDNDYQLTSLSNYMRQDKYLQYLINSYEKNGEDRQMLVYCVDVNHAQRVMEKYIECGHASIGYIDGNTPSGERKGILDSFKKQETKIIVSIGTLTEGVDLPDAGCIQIARPTDSLTLYLQIIGRGGRPSELYDDFIILDCAGVTQKFGTFSSPRTWSLNPLVNPADQSKKNKVVGKREDGTFTEDPEEMEHLEVVEMTPEEYIEKMSGGVEESERFNVQLEEKTKLTLQELGDKILKKSRLFTKMEASCRHWSDDFTIEFKYREKEKKGTFEIQGGGNSPLRFSISAPSYYSWERSERPDFETVPHYLNGAKIAEYINQKEVRQLLKDTAEEIVDLLEQKIDVDKLKHKMKKFKENQFLMELKEYLKQGKTTFYFSGQFYLSDISSRMHGWCNVIKFQRPKLLSQNEATFYSYSKGTGSRMYEDSYDYLDKDQLTNLLFHHTVYIKDENGEQSKERVPVWETLFHTETGDVNVRETNKLEIA